MEREQKGYKRWRKEKRVWDAAFRYCMAWLLHSWTWSCYDCLQKTCTNLDPPTFCHRVWRNWRSQPSLRIYRKLKVMEVEIFFRWYSHSKVAHVSLNNPLPSQPPKGNSIKLIFKNKLKNTKKISKNKKLNLSRGGQQLPGWISQILSMHDMGLPLFSRHFKNPGITTQNKVINRWTRSIKLGSCTQNTKICVRQPQMKSLKRKQSINMILET